MHPRLFRALDMPPEEMARVQGETYRTRHANLAATPAL